MAIPARFKKSFADGIVLGRAYDNCLVVYTLIEWEKAASEIAQQPNTSASARRLARLTFSGAYVGSLDRHARVVIPAQLREYAGLAESAIIVGTGRFIEIWSTSAWSEERSSLDTEATEIAERALLPTPTTELRQVLIHQDDVGTRE